MFFRQETCAEIGIHSVCFPLVCSSETIILWNLLLGTEQNVNCFSESFMNLLPTFQKTQTQIKYRCPCTHLPPKCLGVAWGTGLQQGVCGQECPRGCVAVPGWACLSWVPFCPVAWPNMSWVSLCTRPPFWAVRCPALCGAQDRQWA